MWDNVSLLKLITAYAANYHTSCVKSEKKKNYKNAYDFKPDSLIAKFKNIGGARLSTLRNSEHPGNFFLTKLLLKNLLENSNFLD